MHPFLSFALKAICALYLRAALLGLMNQSSATLLSAAVFLALIGVGPSSKDWK